MSLLFILTCVGSFCCLLVFLVGSICCLLFEALHHTFYVEHKQGETISIFIGNEFPHMLQSLSFFCLPFSVYRDPFSVYSDHASQNTSKTSGWFLNSVKTLNNSPYLQTSCPTISCQVLYPRLLCRALAKTVFQFGRQVMQHATLFLIGESHWERRKTWC